MKASPDPGLRGVGDATPNPGAALPEDATELCPSAARRQYPTPPTEAMLAALAWHANQAIAGQVAAAYALSELARTHGLAVAASAASTLPQSPLRDAIATASGAYVALAENAAAAASRFGRSFGHLAFAFPRPH